MEISEVDGPHLMYDHGPSVSILGRDFAGNSKSANLPICSLGLSARLHNSLFPESPSPKSYGGMLVCMRADAATALEPFRTADRPNLISTTLHAFRGLLEQS